MPTSMSIPTLAPTDEPTLVPSPIDEPTNTPLPTLTAAPYQSNELGLSKIEWEQFYNKALYTF